MPERGLPGVVLQTACVGHHLAVMVLFKEIGGRSENGMGGAGVVLILGIRGGYLAARRWWCSSVKRMDGREGLPKGSNISPQPLAHSLR